MEKRLYKLIKKLVLKKIYICYNSYNFRKEIIVIYRGGEAIYLALGMVRTKIFQEICCKEADLGNKIKKLEGDLQQNPDNKEKARELAIIYHYIRKDKEAIKIYEKILKHFPNDSNILAFLGYLYYELEDFNKAIDYLNQSLDIDSAAPFVFFLLGNAYAREGMVIEAVDAYDFAIFLDFDMYQAHLDFAGKYEDMGRIKRALKEYIAAYEIDSRDKEILHKIKELELKLKEA